MENELPLKMWSFWANLNEVHHPQSCGDCFKKDSSKGKNDVNRLPKRHVNSMTMPLTIRKEGLVKAMVW